MKNQENKNSSILLFLIASLACKWWSPLNSCSGQVIVRAKAVPQTGGIWAKPMNNGEYFEQEMKNQH